MNATNGNTKPKAIQARFNAPGSKQTAEVHKLMELAKDPEHAQITAANRPLFVLLDAAMSKDPFDIESRNDWLAYYRQALDMAEIPKSSNNDAVWKDLSMVRRVLTSSPIGGPLYLTPSQQAVVTWGANEYQQLLLHGEEDAMQTTEG